ncbi:MAG: maleylpyruvate isomerase N-terminal domain-containing protein [Pseudorhodobacter sp.]|nr:maleylpyruvate isomerase N-terminal domain-containing protein [Frankiaceae bacterium]
MLGPDLFTGPCGLAATDPVEVGHAVLSSWDAFLEVASAADLDRPSRLPGWSGRQACIHMGSWDDRVVLTSILEAARSGGGGHTPSAAEVDLDNARLVAAHRDASTDDVLEALQDSRDVLAAWFASSEPAELARARVRSSVGELPVLSLLHAGCYELAVHALDLAPCGAPAPPPELLSRGLGALIDVTGALSTRSGIDITVTAQGGSGGWAFTSGPDGWTTQPVPAGEFAGVGVRGTVPDLLDASAGRAALPLLLLQRRLHVQQLSSFMRLAPLVSEVPGLPGGAALRTGITGLSAVTGGVGKLLGRLRR